MRHFSKMVGTEYTQKLSCILGHHDKWLIFFSWHPFQSSDGYLLIYYRKNKYPEWKSCKLHSNIKCELIRN